MLFSRCKSATVNEKSPSPSSRITLIVIARFFAVKKVLERLGCLTIPSPTSHF